MFRRIRWRHLNLERLEPRHLLAAEPVITEFLASNKDGLLDGNGNPSDWIEIYNAGDTAVDLEGWHLTDDASNLTRWTFPDAPESELDPGEYLVVFASSLGVPDLAGNLHTNFSLAAGGEYLGLIRPDLSVASEYGLGGTDYPAQRSDVSYGVQGSVPPSAEGILYHDADEAPGGNTTGLFSGWVPRGAGAGDGSQNFGNEGGTLQATGSVGEIATTVTGLNPNQTYEVFAFFWDDIGAGVWNIQAGLTSGALIDFDVNSPSVFSIDNTTQFVGSDQLVSGLNVLGQGSDTYDDWVDSNRILYAAPLGQVGASDSVTVYIDHNSSLSARTFYDGIGVRPTGNLVARESAAQYLIPTNGDLGTSWTANGFDAAANGFVAGQASLGYENNPGNNVNSFADEILTTVPSGTTSVYVRTEFEIADASSVTSLLLSMKYDDGFVAYLNGTIVAEQFAPDNPVFNSVSEATGRSDQDSLQYQDFSLFAFVDQLVDGTNTLAIHALNRFSGSTDFLMSPRLTLSTGTLDLDQVRFHPTPTPGIVNGVGVEGFVGDTTFSVDRGFYTAPFHVAITTPTTPTADIYYTFDGTVPAPNNASATLYTGPVSITTTTNLRAAGYIDGFEPSNVDTQTYVFLDDVLNQDPLNNPQNGLSYPTTWQGGFAGDYTIDQRVVTQWDDNNLANTDFGIRQALQSLPTISLTLPHEDLWGTGSNGSGGIYPNATSEGPAWRRAGSVEYFDPVTGEEFQYNAGITMQGNASRDNNRLKKHSFRLIFNDDFDGPTRLRFPLFDNSDFDDINTVSLKASFTDSFPTRTITNRYSPLDSTYLRDVWMRDTQLATGNPVADSTYAHLYINGLYWGLYWPTERNDDAFLASRLGGEREDWDIVRDFNELFRGQRTAYDQMISLSRQIRNASAGTANDLFQTIQGNLSDGTDDPDTDALLDVDNFIDYMILHLYGGVEDWPSHNWYAARNRVDPGKGFIFMTWDQEIALDQLFRDRTDNATNSNTPGELFRNLRNSSEFRLRFADRVQKHLFNDGALTTEANQARWLNRANQIEAGIIGESARWGDAREGLVVTPYTSSGPIQAQITPGSKTLPLVTVDHWRESVDYVHDVYFPNADDLLINRLLNDDLYTSLDAPVYQIGGVDQHGGLITSGSSLNITAPGTIYFTTDGSDPRAVGGAITGMEFTGSVTINATTVIKARTFSGGQWSALSEATFTVADDLFAITEINFNPYEPTAAELLIDPTFDNDDFEFIEVMNTSPTESLNLDGIQLTDAVTFTFSNHILGPGERALVVVDTDAFEARYGTGLNVVGQWSGALSNGGEEIVVLSSIGTEIFSIEYNDSDPWAVSADGAGATLLLDDASGTPTAQRDKFYRWRGSIDFGGTPGADNRVVVDADRIVINEVLAHTELPAVDAIELFNPTNTNIDVSGWQLSNAAGNLRKFTIPSNTILAAGDYLVFDETDFNTGINAFTLDVDGDQVYLTRPDGSGGILFVDQVDFDGSLRNESLGRVPNGLGRLAPQLTTTLGAANSTARIEEVIISEVNYHPENPTAAAQDAFQAIAGTSASLIDNDLEFVEIHNSSSSTVDLTGWRLRGESDFDLPAGTLLAADASLLLVTFDPATDTADLAGFIEHYGLNGSNVALLGGLSNNLNNGFGRVELEQPDSTSGALAYVTADEVLYDDLAPWPTSIVDGGGQSLQRRGPDHYGNDATSWTAAIPSPGGVAFDTGDFDNDNDVDGADFLAWQRGFGSTYDVDDLQTWQDNYGQSTTTLQAGLVDQTETDNTFISVDPGAANLFDVAMAAIHAAEQTQAPEQPIEDRTTSEKVMIRLVADSPDRSDTSALGDSVKTSAAEPSNSEIESASWLTDELLEQVFG